MSPGTLPSTRPRATSKHPQTMSRRTHRDIDRGRSGARTSQQPQTASRRTLSQSASRRMDSIPHSPHSRTQLRQAEPTGSLGRPTRTDSIRRLQDSTTSGRADRFAQASNGEWAASPQQDTPSDNPTDRFARASNENRQNPPPPGLNYVRPTLSQPWGKWPHGYVAAT